MSKARCRRAELSQQQSECVLNLEWLDSLTIIMRIASDKNIHPAALPRLILSSVAL